jgi:hypothetical protein
MHHDLHHIGGNWQGDRAISGQSRVATRLTIPSNAVAIRTVFFIEGFADRSSAV